MKITDLSNLVAVETIVNHLYPILIAILVLVVGVIVAKIIRKVIKSILKKANIEKKIADSPVGNTLGDYSPIKFFVNILYVYLLLIVVLQAVSFAKLDMLSHFITNIANLFPIFIYGVILIIVGLFVGEYVAYYTRRAPFLFAGLVANIVKYIILFFFLIMALPHFMIDPSLITDTFKIILMAFAVAFALGLGLAIGLGAKDTVAEILKSKKESILKSVNSAEEKIKSKK
ncbi:MAG: hypothetical protein COZ66_02165 [Candidatus Huberarchaeum crystalense]|uniref:Uncharacterized protein n=2 Tax=Huberarchaeum crystalense TaxID=2014257 RepID=A0A2G9LJ93_HUBC1|nr:hypothetical protein [archaeon]OIP20854.1 MAG: hypothetical protein AUJ91_00200 [archaeon CG2_30_31_98]PIN66613.1 MAG: hypothetical protein COW69_01275 [Candidatus Huberarchaeum crystalense]NCS98230.1 hypothetical protein [archaeon]PIV13545.1 MAG: hypothetical protein COS45_02225 [Candidatus Huberarchaeum crystalense]